jgi:hypothetical protein
MTDETNISHNKAWYQVRELVRDTEFLLFEKIPQTLSELVQGTKAHIKTSYDILMGNVPEQAREGLGATLAYNFISSANAVGLDFSYRALAKNPIELRASLLKKAHIGMLS